MQDDEDVFANPMELHYDNPELNAFDDGFAEGINPEEMKKTCSLLLRIPYSLSRNGIKNLMSVFGEIKRVHIPNEHSQQHSRQRSNFIAFVDFSTFTEAERAIRALHSSANSGLGIKAELANSRNNRPSFSAPIQQPQHDVSIPNEIDQSPPPPSFDDIITFNLDFAASTNENVEKVTQFEYCVNRPKNERALKQLESLEKLARNSKWEFDENYEHAVYNKKQVFLKFACNHCNRIAILRDEKTRKYYCSLKCYQNIEEASDNQQSELKQSDKVVITAIISEKILFVRKCHDDHHQLLENVYRTAKSQLKELEMIPSVDDEVIVKVFDDIFRAKILEILYNSENENNLGFIVQLTDLGHTARVKWEDLFEMTMECLQLPRLVTRVTLKDVNVNSINLNVINYLCSLRETELKITSIENNHVELKDGEGFLVNEKIIQLTKVENPAKNAAISAKDLPPLASTTGSDKKLFCINKKYLEETGIVWCIEEKFVKDFYEFQKALYDYGQTVDLNKFGASLHDLCIFKIKDQWYRGQVLEMRGNGTPNCILYDIWVMCEVPVECIFPMPSVFSNPFYSDSYKIHNYAESSQEKKEFVNNFIVENDFFVADEVMEGCKDLIIIFHSLKNNTLSI